MRIGAGNASLRPGFRGAGLAHIATMLRGLSGGGTERVALAVAGGLAACGHRVDLVFPDSPERFYPARIPEGVRPVFCGAGPEARAHTARFTIPDNALWLADGPSLRERLRLVFGLLRHPEHFALFRPRVLRRAFALLPYLRHERPDVVFANSPSLESPLNILLQNQMVTPLPIIPVIHNVLLRKFERRALSLRAASRIVAVSKGVARNISERCGIAPEQITTIYNPAFTADAMRRTEEGPTHAWFSDGGPPIILGVGRLTPQKDFPTLIDAFRRVRARQPCRLAILGEGPLRRELETLVAAHGMTDSVALPGWVENPYAWMARSALFVLSSVHEGFGLVLVEAMAVGCPAVSTDCPAGPAEILEDPELLAPVGDAAALAHVMQHALACPVDKGTLRAKAARFSAEQAVAKYDEIVSAVIGKGQGLSARAASPTPVPVCVINLDRRPDRWTTMSEQFDRLGITAMRIPAVDARLLAAQEPQDTPVSIRRRKWGYVPDLGSVACNRSHAKALRAFLDTDASAALILEDDVILASDTPALLESVDWWPACASVIRLEAGHAMEARVPLWDVCAETPSGRGVHRFERWHSGAAAYLVNRATAEWMLPYLDDPSNPVTDSMWFNHRYCPLARELKALQIVPGMARQIEALESSDLEGWRRGIGPDWLSEIRARLYNGRVLALRALGKVHKQRVPYIDTYSRG